MARSIQCNCVRSRIARRLSARTSARRVVGALRWIGLLLTRPAQRADLTFSRGRAAADLTLPVTLAKFNGVSELKQIAESVRRIALADEARAAGRPNFAYEAAQRPISRFGKRDAVSIFQHFRVISSQIQNFHSAQAKTRSL